MKAETQFLEMVSPEPLTYSLDGVRLVGLTTGLAFKVVDTLRHFMPVNSPEFSLCEMVFEIKKQFSKESLNSIINDNATVVDFQGCYVQEETYELACEAIDKVSESLTELAIIKGFCRLIFDSLENSL